MVLVPSIIFPFHIFIDCIFPFYKFSWLGSYAPTRGSDVYKLGTLASLSGQQTVRSSTRHGSVQLVMDGTGPVDAAVVVFRLKQRVDYPQVSSTKSFFSMVNSSFNGKRKMLRKSLQHITSSLEIEEALVNIGLLATSRPEELTLEDFVKLHNLIVDT
ncbi:hypothetical protein L6452_36500 [Arctium lappa]|uniref:Uncharacterized protein n=1 Tax=Arctium lappa TaxID=4217 RepID=A0ACB8YAV3_ARCLA|nr:hypothetical protein L6452_36500 [Arctium lappa]